MRTSPPRLRGRPGSSPSPSVRPWRRPRPAASEPPPGRVRWATEGCALGTRGWEMGVHPASDLVPNVPGTTKKPPRRGECSWKRHKQESGRGPQICPNEQGAAIWNVAPGPPPFPVSEVVLNRISCPGRSRLTSPLGPIPRTKSHCLCLKFTFLVQPENGVTEATRQLWGLGHLSSGESVMGCMFLLRSGLLWSSLLPDLRTRPCLVSSRHVFNFGGRFCFLDENSLLPLSRSSGLALNLRAEGP